ncbi:MAG TPA: glutathione S-transferase [Pseudomonas xinjiangensis]|uniref:glutathione transferase n=2 Tax=root TaxID=1 RepID=A0A7V1BLE0_9GAMM|nr:glutathione S-transferase [Halopseudomonas xinjiangensis]HEC46950.1 glutathione S-transferase [Halopseudomonas xinjiangensis]
MITVHHLNNSRSQRIIWLLEELGLEYEVKRYERNPKTMLAPPELFAVHPLGKSPVITDAGLTVAESGAIIEYLVDTYDSQGILSPQRGSAERLEYTYWLHYAEGSAMLPLLLKLIFSHIESAPMPFFAKPFAKGISQKVRGTLINPQLKQHLDYMEAEISKTGWFAGSQFSAADVQMSFPLEAASARGGLDDSRPGLMDFLKRIHARSGYQRALERGGEYGILG